MTHGTMKNWTMKTTARSAAACGLVVVAALGAARAGQTPAAPATAPVAEAPASEPDRTGAQTGENAGDTLAARVDERFNVLSHEVAWMDGTTSTLERYRGKVLLLVNTASRCGLTPQYADLEGLHEELAGENFAVVGFPCNQFGAQEPGSPEEIQAFCSATYGVTFPMSAKLEVNGAGRHPLYAWLTDPANGHPGDIEWNFEKFLVGRDGRLLNRYAPTVKPRDAGLMNDIADAL